LPSLDIVRDRGRDELVHLCRVANGEAQANDGAHGIAEHVGFRETERVHECRDVIRHVGIRDGPVDVGRAAVALELHRIDPVGLGEPGDDRAHGRDVHVRTVEHDQRIAIARDLVIHLHAVDPHAIPDGLGVGDGGAGEKQGCSNDG
jgi:hypothetical protein